MTLFDSPGITRSILDGTADAIWVAYPAGVVCSVNAPFRERFGWSVSELNDAGGIGALFADHEDAAAAFDAIARGDKWEGTASLLTDERETLAVTHRVWPIADEGEFCAIAGYVPVSD